MISLMQYIQLISLMNSNQSSFVTKVSVCLSVCLYLSFPVLFLSSFFPAKLVFKGNLKVSVKTASKYDDARLLHVPNLKVKFDIIILFNYVNYAILHFYGIINDTWTYLPLLLNYNFPLLFPFSPFFSTWTSLQSRWSGSVEGTPMTTIRSCFVHQTNSQNIQVTR